MPMICYYLLLDQSSRYQLKAYHEASPLIKTDMIIMQKAMITRFNFPFKLLPTCSDKKRLSFYETLIEGLAYGSLLSSLRQMSKNQNQNTDCAKRLLMRLEHGLSFSQSLYLEGCDFPIKDLAFLKQAERVDALEIALKQLKSDLEYSRSLKATVKDKLRYPLFLLASFNLLVFYLIKIILPKMNFVDVPLFHYGNLLLLGILVMVATLVLLYCFQPVKCSLRLRKYSPTYCLLDSLSVLSMLQLACAQFQSHYELISFVASLSHKKSIQSDFNLLKSLLEQGHSITSSVHVLDDYHPLLLELLSQEIDKQRYAKTYTLLFNKLNQRLVKLSALLEPVMILLMGSMLLYILIVVVKPMLSYYNTLI